MTDTARSWLFGALALALGAATALFAVWLGDVEGYTFWLGVALVSVTTIGAITWSVRKEGDALSPLTLSAIFYFLTFAAGAVYFWFNPALPGFNSRPVGNRDHLPFGVVFGGVAFLLFVVGYIANPLRRVPRRLPAIARLDDIRSPWTVVAALLAIGWLSRLLLISQGLYFHTAVQVEESGGATWFIRTFSTVPLLALAFCGAYGFLAGGRPGAAGVRRAFWVLFVIEVVYATPTAERGMLVALALIYGAVRYYGAGRLPWKGMLAAGLVLVMLVFPFIDSYRSGGQGSAKYQNDPTQNLAKAQQNTLTGQSFGGLLDQGSEKVLQRFVGVTSLVQIDYSDRAWFTRAPGETLTWIPTGFVPRAFFPDKPDPGLYGNEFGRSHLMIASRDYITAITPLQSGELYLNFGWLGLILGMPIVGAVYRLFGEYMRDRRRSPGTLAAYAVLAWPIISAHESILAVGVVGVTKTLLIYGLVLYGVGRLAAAPVRAFVPSGSRAVAS